MNCTENGKIDSRLQGHAGECYNNHRMNKMEDNAVKRWKWAGAWIVQILIMLALGCLTALAELLGAVAYGVAAWAVMPLAGLLTACRATRRGLLNYAAWIAPPACMWLTHWLIWDYSPEPGPALVCALASLVGAAAGEVLNQQAAHK